MPELNALLLQPLNQDRVRNFQAFNILVTLEITHTLRGKCKELRENIFHKTRALLVAEQMV